MASLHRRAKGEPRPAADGRWRVRWQERRGGKVRYGWLLNPDLLDEYSAYERRCWEQGVVPDAPEVRFPDGSGEFGVPSSATDAADCPGTGITLAEWIGTPDEPGQFFTAGRPMGANHQSQYLNLIQRPEFDGIRDRPLAAITPEDIRAVVAWWAHCPNCLQTLRHRGSTHRAADARAATSANPPCGAENGSSHATALSKATFRNHCVSLRTIFNVAASPIEGDPVISQSPVPTVAQLANGLIFRASSDGTRRSLARYELQALADCSPPELALLPLVGAYGQMRVSELFGLNVGDITFDVRDGQRMQARIRLSRVFVRDVGGRILLRTYGKTATSLRDVYLPPSLSAELHEFCSDLPAETPLWSAPDGRRLNPGTYTKRIWPRIVEAAGLNEATLGFAVHPRHLRSCGATLLIETGTPIAEVARIGGWTNTATLEQHYFRLRDDTKAAAAARLDSWTERESESAEELRIALREAREEIAYLRSQSTRVQRTTVRAAKPRSERSNTRRPGPPSRWDDAEHVKAIIESSASRREALTNLGLSHAAKNYQRLDQFADEHGVELPARWRRRTPVAS